MNIIHICFACRFQDEMGYQESILPKYHVKKGHKVSVISTRDMIPNHLKHTDLSTDLPIIYNHNGLKIIRLKEKFNLVSRFIWYKDFFSILCAEAPDIIMVHGIQTVELLTVKKYVTLNPNCIFIVDIHSDYYNSANSFLSLNILHKIFWRILISLCIEKINKVYATLPWRKVFAEKVYKIPPEKLDVLYLGADTEKVNFTDKYKIRNKIREKLGIKDNAIVIISGGKIDKEKRFNNLIASFERLYNENTHLIIFGSVETDYKEMFDNMIVNLPNFSYIGWISPEEVYNYYLASDIAVFPGTHSVLWEQAVFSGLVTIFKYWPLMEYLGLENSIFLYSDRTEELEIKLRELIDNSELIIRMKKKALEHGDKYFSYEKTAEIIVSLGDRDLNNY